MLAAALLLMQKALIHWRLKVKAARDNAEQSEADPVKLSLFERYNLLVMVPLALMIYGVLGEQLAEVIDN